MHFSVDTKTAGLIRESGQFIRQGAVSLRFLPHDSYRYSPVVSKKQGGAVERNRVKRVIREIMLKGAGRYPEGAYLVFFNGACTSLDKKILASDIDKLMSMIEKTSPALRAPSPSQERENGPVYSHPSPD